MPSRSRRPLIAYPALLMCTVFLLATPALFSQDIRTSITVYDNLAHSRTLTVGINSSASDGIDGALGESLLPPTPPGVFDARLIDTDLRFPTLLFTGVRTDLRGIYSAPPITQQFEVQVRRAFGASATFFSWSLPLQAGITAARITSYPDPSIVDIDMTTQTQLLLPTSANRYMVTITYGGPALQRYKLTADIAPAGRGNITISPNQVDYAAGTTVTLTAQNLPAPDTCFVFSHWTGDAIGTNPTVLIVMDTAKHVVANYVRRQFPVTVSTLDTFFVQSTPPAPQKLYLRNSGLACYDWTVTANDPWINLSKNAGRGDDSLLVSILASAIPCQGTHVGSISLVSNGSIPRNITIPVIVLVGRSDVTATVLGAPVLLSCETKAQDAIFVTLYNDAVSPLVFPNAPVAGQGFILKNPGLFPLSIPGRDSARLIFEFVPDQTQRGVIVDNIIMNSSTCGRQAFFKLTGTRIAPTVTADVHDVDFGTINACPTDPLPSRTVVLRNAHGQPALLRYTVPAGITLTSAPTSVPAYGSVDLVFEPARLGPVDINTTLGVAADFGICVEALDITLHGRRQAPSFLVEAVATPGALPPQTFDSTCVGRYSAPKGIRVSNNGSAPLNFTLAIAAPFELDGFASTFALQPGENRIVDVRFHPTAPGVFSQPFTITADQCALTSSVTLEGSTYEQQILQAVLTPSLLSLANCETDGKILLTVTNTGSQAAVFTELPPLPSGFAWDSTLTLPVIIAPGGSSPLATMITFTPPAGQSGTFGGSVSWYGDPCGTSVYFTLAGERIVPSAALSPRSLDFGSIVNCGPTTLPVVKTVTFTNASPLPVTFTLEAPTNSYRLLIGPVDFPSQGVTVLPATAQDFSIAALPGSGGRFNDSLLVRIFAGASNACSETKVLPLSGEKFTPAFALLVKPNQPEFDNVCVGTAVTCTWEVVNSGDKRLTVTSPGFDAASPFSLPSLPFSVTLAPGEKSDLPIRFRPAAEGSFSAPVVFTQDACPGELTLTVQGTAIQPLFDITAVVPAQQISILSCEPSLSRQFRATVANTGTSPVTIADGSIPPEGFVYDPPGQFPFTLMPGGTRDVVLRFAPPAPGAYGGLVRLFSAPCRGEATFSVGARLLKTDFAVSPQEIDLGDITVCPSGTIRDADLEKLMREVTFRNTGEVALSVEAVIKPASTTPALQIVSPAGSPFLVNANMIQKVAVSVVTPIDSTLERLSASLELTIRRSDTSSCPPEVVAVPFTARIRRTNFAFLQDSVSTLVTCAAQPVTVYATLHNKGNAPASFRFAIDGSPAFALVDSLSEISLAPGQLKDVPVVYTPDTTGGSSAILIARDLMCGAEAHVHLDVTVKRSTLQLACNKNAGISPQQQVRPGDQFIIPIYLSDEIACAGNPLEVSFRMTFDVHNLSPVAFRTATGAATIRRIDPGTIEVSIAADKFLAGELGLLVMEVLVGKDKQYQYAIQNPAVRPDVGGVLLDQSCSGTLQVRPRLGVSTWRELGISQLSPPRPNVTEGNGGTTHIDFELGRDAYVELAIHDRLGNRVVTVFSGSLSRGIHSMEHQVSALPSGLYLISLNTGSEFLTQKFIVAR
ncbi:MAG: choice-of-anchor D domain-containing protein [Ignavibacteriae bacterium]|nr:choice-of-anchor D domain-containing protein [Ignavibacteriota bacterium]